MSEDAIMWDNFLKKKIMCYNCGKGPSNFSVIMIIRNNYKELIEKYEKFCSEDCYMSFFSKSYEQQKVMKDSRCSTPTRT